MKSTLVFDADTVLNLGCVGFNFLQVLGRDLVGGPFLFYGRWTAQRPQHLLSKLQFSHCSLLYYGMNKWRETKYHRTKSGLIASSDPNEVSPSSQIIATLIGQFYSKQIPIHVKGDLIDLGCGKAPLWGTYSAYSTSQQFLDVENRLEHTDLNYQTSLNEPITCVHRQFDTAILSDVLEHLEQPDVALSSISRLLRKNGVLIMTIPFLYGIHEAPNDFRRLTRFGLNIELSKAGFLRIEIHEIGGLISVIATLTSKLLNRACGTFTLPVQVFTVLYKTMMRIPVIAKIDQKTAKIFPLEYGVICSV